MQSLEKANDFIHKNGFAAFIATAILIFQFVQIDSLKSVIHENTIVIQELRSDLREIDDATSSQ